MFVLHAIYHNGEEAGLTAGYYTGRAGQGWVGVMSEAFGYSTKAEAERKAAVFNGRMALTGLVFEVRLANPAVPA